MIFYAKLECLEIKFLRKLFSDLGDAGIQPSLQLVTTYSVGKHYPGMNLYLIFEMPISV
jgi:hypothetical protein